MHFEWDKEKNELDCRKHGIDFNLAKLVFQDPVAIVDDDYDIYDEDRLRVLGSVGDKVFVVSYTYRYGGDVVRLISARYARPSERRVYEARRESRVKRAEAKAPSVGIND